MVLSLGRLARGHPSNLKSALGVPWLLGMCYHLEVEASGGEGPGTVIRANATGAAFEA